MHVVLFPDRPFSGLDELLMAFAEVELDDNAGQSETQGELSTSRRALTQSSASTVGAAASLGKEESLVWHIENIAGRLHQLKAVRISPRMVLLSNLMAV